MFPEPPTNELVLLDPTPDNYLLTLMLDLEKDTSFALLDPRLWSIEHPKQMVK